MNSEIVIDAEKVNWIDRRKLSVELISKLETEYPSLTQITFTPEGIVELDGVLVFNSELYPIDPRDPYYLLQWAAMFKGFIDIDPSLTGWNIRARKCSKMSYSLFSKVMRRLAETVAVSGILDIPIREEVNTSLIADTAVDPEIRYVFISSLEASQRIIKYILEAKIKRCTIDIDVLKKLDIKYIEGDDTQLSELIVRMVERNRIQVKQVILEDTFEVIVEVPKTIPFYYTKGSSELINPLWVHNLLVDKCKTFTLSIDEYNSLVGNDKFSDRGVAKLAKKITLLGYPFSVHIKNSKVVKVPRLVFVWYGEDDIKLEELSPEIDTDNLYDEDTTKVTLIDNVLTIGDDFFYNFDDEETMLLCNDEDIVEVFAHTGAIETSYILVVNYADGFNIGRMPLKENATVISMENDKILVLKDGTMEVYNKS